MDNQQFINSLLKDKTELEAKLAYINDLLSRNSKNGNSTTKVTDVGVTYKDILSGAALGKEVVELFKRENRFLHVREMFELLSENNNVGDQKEFSNKISAVLSKLKKDGTLVNYTADGKNVNTFWGAPKWLDDKGNVKSGHGHNPKYMTVRKSVEI